MAIVAWHLVFRIPVGYRFWWTDWSKVRCPMKRKWSQLESNRTKATVEQFEWISRAPGLVLYEIDGLNAGENINSS